MRDKNKYITFQFCLARSSMAMGCFINKVASSSLVKSFLVTI